MSNKPRGKLQQLVDHRATASINPQNSYVVLREGDSGVGMVLQGYALVPLEEYEAHADRAWQAAEELEFPLAPVPANPGDFVWEDTPGCADTPAWADKPAEEPTPFVYQGARTTGAQLKEFLRRGYGGKPVEEPSAPVDAADNSAAAIRIGPITRYMWLGDMATSSPNPSLNEPIEEVPYVPGVGRLRIYSGAQPDDPDAPVERATALLDIGMPEPAFGKALTGEELDAVIQRTLDAKGEAVGEAIDEAQTYPNDTLWHDVSLSSHGTKVHISEELRKKLEDEWVARTENAFSFSDYGSCPRPSRASAFELGAMKYRDGRYRKD